MSEPFQMSFGGLYSTGMGNFGGRLAHWKALVVFATVYTAKGWKGIIQLSVTALHAIQPFVKILYHLLLGVMYDVCVTVRRLSMFMLATNTSYATNQLLRLSRLAMLYLSDRWRKTDFVSSEIWKCGFWDKWIDRQTDVLIATLCTHNGGKVINNRCPRSATLLCCMIS